MQEVNFNRPAGADLPAILRLPGKLWRAAGRLHTGGSLGARCNRVKFLVRGLAFPAATAEWFRFLENPALAGVARQRPKLFQKLQRPYLARRLRTEQRRQVLEQHYRFVLEHLGPGFLRAVHARPGLRLACVAGPGREHYELWLNPSQMDKEGELSLLLVSPEGKNLFSLTFSLALGEPGQYELVIGGLQGAQQANDKESIITLTRHGHGLRPKALLIFTLQQLAAAWGVGRIRAVSDTTHIYQHWRQRKQLASSYDTWWREAGGQLTADGLFDLPARFEPREMATLKTNKRGMYRHRYGMREDLGRQIAASLGVPPPARLVTANSTGTDFGTLPWQTQHGGTPGKRNGPVNIPAAKG